MRYHFTRVSHNAKVGPLPVVTASSDTCPNTCPLKGAGCYAEHGPLAIHWKRLDSSGLNIKELAAHISRLPKRQLWRYGQAGDLPASQEDLDTLVNANAHRPVIAYTHRRDYDVIERACRKGFHINISCDSLPEVDTVPDGFSVVVTLPSEFSRGREETLTAFRNRLGGKLKITTPGGRPIAICPATYVDVSCASCGLCAASRASDTVIGFPAHGSRKRMIDNRLSTASKWTNAHVTKAPRSSPISSSTLPLNFASH